MNTGQSCHFNGVIQCLSTVPRVKSLLEEHKRASENDASEYWNFYCATMHVVISRKLFMLRIHKIIIIYLLLLDHKTCVRCKLHLMIAMLHLHNPAVIGKKIIISMLRGTFTVHWCGVNCSIVISLSLWTDTQCTHSINTDLCMWSSSELGLNPYVPSDPRETFIEVLQRVPELGMVFQNKIVTQSKEPW